MSTGAGKRAMVFIDGSNFLVGISEYSGCPYRAGKPPVGALGAARQFVEGVLNDALGSQGGWSRPQWTVVRRYWFSSFEGSEEERAAHCIELRKRDFEPTVFRKPRNGKEKGVDIALAKEMLINAFNKNFDLGILIAGDADYVGLVQDVKRFGPILQGAFFTLPSLSPDLQLAFDRFMDLGKITSADAIKNMVEPGK